MVNSNVFWEPYVLFASGAMSVPPLQVPLSDVAQKTLFGFARQPVFADTMR